MTNPLLARFADVPSLVEPGMAARFEACLQAVVQHERADALLSAVNDDGFWFAADDWRSAYRPYVVRDGILHIPVKGVLLHDFPWALGSWATGYAYIARALDRGLQDGNVRGIALIVYSPGGEGHGCFDLSNRIYAARGVKPIRAFAEMAYSAGYALACAAESITISRSAGAGSIGVVMTHLDISRAMENAGMKVTFVKFGKHKTDGNRFEPLAPDVEARWQTWCNEMGNEFCELVAQNRGLDLDKVKATEADCFSANEALALGLVDGIAVLDDAVTIFDPTQSDADEDEGETDMSSSVPAAGAAAQATEAALATARSEGHAAGKAEGSAEGVKQGATAERGRISAILGSDDAKGRTELAQHLAFETEMSADDARKLLAKSPKEGTQAATDQLGSAMANLKNPTVGADPSTADQTDDQKAAALASSIVSNYTGKKPVQSAA